MKERSANMAAYLGSDISLEVGPVVPLDIHFETEHAFALSMFTEMKSIQPTAELEMVIATTVSFVYIGERVIFLYCYGGENDLEWTRDASKTWVEKTLQENSR